ncbi:MAG: hypothetical protein JSR57_11750, partial [Verrucomicrobia bacterium]|nr:hypothetical protein [Verrucomicrobiota bacterium]
AQLGTINSWIASTFSLNPNDPIYNGFRDKTTLGLEVASLITGGYAAAKGIVRFSKLAKTTDQITKIAKLSTQQIKCSNGFFGNKGFELKNTKYQKIRNDPTIIQGRSYGGHALDQMQNRGFTPSVVEETMQNGISAPNKVAGRTQFYDFENNITVVTEDNKVVTVTYEKTNK